MSLTSTRGAYYIINLFWGLHYQSLLLSHNTHGSKHLTRNTFYRWFLLWPNCTQKKGYQIVYPCNDGTVVPLHPIHVHVVHISSRIGIFLFNSKFTHFMYIAWSTSTNEVVLYLVGGGGKIKIEICLPAVVGSKKVVSSWMLEGKKWTLLRKIFKNL